MQLWCLMKIKVQLLLFPLSLVVWPSGHTRLPWWMPCSLFRHSGRWTGPGSLVWISEQGEEVASPGGKKVFSVDRSAKEWWQAGNLMKIAIFSMEIRAYFVKKVTQLKQKFSTESKHLAKYFTCGYLQKRGSSEKIISIILKSLNSISWLLLPCSTQGYPSPLHLSFTSCSPGAAWYTGSARALLEGEGW